jgi:NADH:ubiquinone oxidoreductase subunit 2 (subunit N)
MALRIAAVSSVTPSPFTPRLCTFAHSSVGGKAWIAGHDEAIVEFIHLIEAGVALYLLSAVAKKRQRRHILKYIFLESNFSERAFLVADDHCLPGNFLENAVLSP